VRVLLADCGGTAGWLVPYGMPVYVGAGLHLPSGPGGWPSTGTYLPFHSMSATVTHHGTPLGTLVDRGVEFTGPGDGVVELPGGPAGALGYGTLDVGCSVIVSVIVTVDVETPAVSSGDGTVTKLVMTTCVVLRPLDAEGDIGTDGPVEGWAEIVGCTEFMLEVGLCVILPTLGVDVGAGTDVPIVGGTDGVVVVRGALHGLTTVRSVVGTVGGDAGALLVGAVGALG
jgi:hypothetical protein